MPTPEEDRLFVRAVQPSIAELRELALEETKVDGRTRARARLALQAISERIQRAAERDLPARD